MNDERFLRDWLRDSTDSTTNPRAAADEVVTRLPDNPQRSRWWPWRSRRRASPDTPRRTRLMLNPTSAVAAGALTLTVAAAFLITRPLVPTELGSAAELDDSAAPVEVTITGFGGGCNGGTFDAVGIKATERGSTCAPTLAADDERLSGTVTYASNTDRYTDDSRLTIEAFAISIENDEGAWRSRPVYWLEYPGAADTGSDVWVLDGEDAYEGLTAVLIQDGFYAFHGFVLDGELPPMPDNG